MKASLALNSWQIPEPELLPKPQIPKSENPHPLCKSKTLQNSKLKDPGEVCRPGLLHAGHRPLGSFRGIRDI